MLLKSYRLKNERLEYEALGSGKLHRPRAKTRIICTNVNYILSFLLPRIPVIQLDAKSPKAGVAEANLYRWPYRHHRLSPSSWLEHSVHVFL
jgi:hypothetical protein